ncbi:TolC family protein [Algoriphagus sp.]|jgi:outer membrane protein|uniref:TolC family protein n=2 Tax=Algoriphagus sp. TaxID=1872435 RepID=UPI0027288C08|nr:TolC family protein [Algoriphagus sp.]MDO8968182.1 TolC family protein [Algoriphagus sp.]MDP3202283.1 TolC family protein [Algoriphagus sp.]
MPKIFLGVILTIGISFFSFAQNNQPVGPFDLQTCVDIALENNLTLKRTELNQQITEANLLQSQGQRIPSFSTGASSGYRWGRSINPVTNLFENNRIGNINLFANSSAPIFRGNQINNTISQARKDLEAGVFNLEATRNDITLNIINLFINVVFNREQVKIAANQLKTTTEQFERTSKLVAAGSLPISDQLDLQSQNSSNQLEVIRAQNNYRIAKLNLAQAMQIPFTDDFDVIEPEFNVENSTMVSEDPNAIYEVAVELMPEIKAAEAGVESAEYQVKIAKGAFLPTLGIGANLFSNYVDQPGFNQREITPFGEQIQNNISQSANLQLNIPIFSNFNNKSAVQRARAQKAISEVTVQEAKNQLRQNIESAYTDAVASKLSYEASLVRVKSLQESFRVSQQRFDLGAINSVDFQVAQANLFNAQADLLNAKYTYIFRIKVLDFYLGNPINLN